MKHLLIVLLLIAFIGLSAKPAHADPCSASEKCYPRLVLKTTSLALAHVKGSPAPGGTQGIIAFGNRGNALLLWRLYVGGDRGVCRVEMPRNWIAIGPETGWNAPGTDSAVTVRVDAPSLPAGTHHAVLCLVTSDPNNQSVTIPLTVVVKD